MKHYKWLIVLVLGSMLLLPSCFPFKAVFLTAPDYKDSQRFPAKTLTPSKKPFQFHTSEQDHGTTLKVNDWTTDLPVFNTITDLVAGHNTTAFLIIRNDTILTEYYGDDYTATDVHPSYSMGKSFTSALIGIAIQEGQISSVNDLAKTYLPQLNFHPYFDQLTIQQLLNHTSGIKGTLALDGTIYYGKDLLKGINKIEFDTMPGRVQSYVNMNSQLLGLILESATGTDFVSYLQEKIWTPLGMETPAFWSTDKKGEAKTYCCLNATAKDFAKFGRLYLNQGNWNGTQIINKAWVAESIRQDTTQGSSFGYNYSWHIGLDTYHDFMAVGLYKQHIYINPEKQLIIVLLNHKEDKLKAERVNWWYVFRQLADQL